MSKALPQSESLKKAVIWVSNQRVLKDQDNLSAIVDEAVFKFDLTPQDAKYLYNLYKNTD